MHVATRKGGLHMPKPDGRHAGLLPNDFNPATPAINNATAIVKTRFLVNFFWGCAFMAPLIGEASQRHQCWVPGYLWRPLKPCRPVRRGPGGTTV